MAPTTTSDTKALEKELSVSLASLKHALIKRSWIDFPKNDSEIGAGGYGTVHRATLRKGIFGTKRDVAVKKLYTVGDWGKRLHVASALVRELLVWASLQHPNVLPFLGFHLSPKLDEAWLVSPFASNGNIYDYLERTRPALDERLELAKDTAKGLEYLHTRSPSICHGDIKAVNVLVGSDKRAMLCDFGLSKSAEDTPASRITTSLDAGGTLRYWSPELFVPNTPPTLESDVWAWGCLLLEIVTGRAPYNDVPLEGRVIHQISQNIPPASLEPGECPEHIRELLAKCWKRESSERPAMTQALAELTAGTLHFLQEGDRQSLLSSTASTASLGTELDSLERELAGILIPLERYLVKPSWFTFPRVGSIIGIGGYGAVQRAMMRRRLLGPGVAVAVKKLRPAGGRDKCLRMVIALIREMTIWSQLHHKHILPFIGYYLSPQLDAAWLVSPYVQNGNLSDYLLGSRPSTTSRLRLALDTAKGLQYLHGLDPPICHGDIKSLNILISDGGDAVLCDFGLAKAMENLPSGLTTSTFNQGGSLPYESPELLLGTSLRALGSDIWAWGCLLQEIFSGKFPYHWANNPGAIVKWITQDIPPATISELNCPNRVKRLLSRCWRKPPSSRPTMTQCVAVLRGGEEDVEEILGVIVDTLPSESVRIKRSDVLFDQTAKLGSGRFGIAYQGSLHPVTGDIGEIVAVKELFTVQDKTARDRLFQEIERTAPVWVGLTHPNINKFLGFCIDGEAMLLVSSLQNGGSLHALLEKGAVEYSRCLELITDMAQGLLYLHSRDPPICHGSIHPGNILVDPQGHAVLSDYDLMSTLERAEVDLANVTDGLWRYESPEVLKRKTPHTPCSDMWSLGCLIFKMVANQTLYADINHPDELKTTVDQGDMPYQVETIDCPARAQNLLGRCWQYAPESRASASEIVGILTGKSFRFGEVKDIPAKELDALRFSRDGKYLALVFGENRDSTVSIYDTETWDIALKLNYPPESSGAQTLQFSTSGRYLATAESKRFAILLWDLTSGELVSEFTGHKGTIWGVDISSGDSFIASGAGDKDPTLRLWHFKGHAGKNHVISVDDKNYFCSVAISPDSTYVVGGLHHGGAGIWNTQTGSRIFTVPDSYGWVRCVQFSPDGRWLVGGNMGGKYSRWEVSKLQESNDTPSLAIFPASNVVVSVSISPDNNWFVFLGETGDVRPVVKGETPESALPSIGKVPGHGIWRNVHLGPVSNTGSGLVAGFAGGGGDVVVAKYVSWDSPGAYRFKAKEVSDEGGSTDDGFPED